MPSFYGIQFVAIMIFLITFVTSLIVGKLYVVLIGSLIAFTLIILSFVQRKKVLEAMFRTALTLFMSSLAIPAVASMRCGTHLVDEGDSVEQVLERCGQPLSRIVNEPALRNNGVPKLNAARTEFWVYGPSGGVYRHLRFIDGKLVEIRLERK